MSSFKFLKRGPLKSLLEKYVSNSDEVVQQISFSKLLRGTCTLHSVHLLPEMLQDMLGAAWLPFCLEVVASWIDELELSIPWTNLRFKPVVLKTRTLHISIVVHNPDSAFSDACTEVERAFWKSQAARWTAAGQATEAACAAGAKEPTLVSIVLAGLQVHVGRVALEFRRPDSPAATVLGEIDKLLFAPVNENWEPATDNKYLWAQVPRFKEALSFKQVGVERIRIHSASADAVVSCERLSVKLCTKTPSLPPRLAPVQCTKCCSTEVGELNCSGDEEPLTDVLAVLNDIFNSLTLADEGMVKLLLGENKNKIKELMAMRRRNTLVVTDLLRDARRESQRIQKTSPLELEEMLGRMRANGSEQTTCCGSEMAPCSDGDSLSSDGEADSECGEIAQEMSVRFNQALGSDVSKTPPEMGPSAAAHRNEVCVAAACVDVVVPEGRLTMRLQRLRLTTDSVVALAAGGRESCAELFEMHCAKGPARVGCMLMEITVDALATCFERKRRGSHARFACRSGKASENYPRSDGADAYVLRLDRVDQTPLRLIRHGPAFPVQYGEFHTEPTEVVCRGLDIMIGEGFDAFKALGERLKKCLPQLAPPHACAEKEPSPSCFSAKLIDTNVRQEAAEGEERSSDGSWPMRVFVPIVEVRSVQGIADLPANLRSACCSEESFMARPWWRPPTLPNEQVTINGTECESIAIDSGGSLADAKMQHMRMQVQSAALAAEIKLLQAERDQLQKENEQVRHEATRGESVLPQPSTDSSSPQPNTVSSWDLLPMSPSLVMRNFLWYSYAILTLAIVLFAMFFGRL